MGLAESGIRVFPVAGWHALCSGDGDDRRQEKGIAAQKADAPLKGVASRNRRTPREVYDALKQASGAKAGPAAHGAPGTGSGMGARTIGQVAKELGLTDDAAVTALSDKGIEARPEEDLRTVSFRRGRRPFEVF